MPSGAGIVNSSLGRDDMARRHCSNAGLLKKNKIMAGSMEAFSTPIQSPCGMKMVAPVRASYCRPAKGQRRNNLYNFTTLRKQRIVPVGMEFGWLQMEFLQF